MMASQERQSAKRKRPTSDEVDVSSPFYDHTKQDSVKPWQREPCYYHEHGDRVAEKERCAERWANK